MSTQTVRLHRWDEIALEKVTEMLSRKIVTGDREMIAQIYLKRGCLVPMHSHESEQMTYILQGALKFFINGEELDASPDERVGLRELADRRMLITTHGWPDVGLELLYAWYCDGFLNVSQPS